MGYKRSFEDILNPQRLYYKLFKDFSEGRLDRQRVFYRARVEDVGTSVGELESEPPSPIGSIRATVYTNALDANIPRFANTVFYPMFPGVIPQKGEHVFVIFEDPDRFSAGIWISQIPNYGNVNYANPDSQDTSTQTTGDTFEGTRSGGGQPSEEDISLRYRTQGGTTEQQAQTIANFEGQESAFWTGKKVLVLGDSQVGESNNQGVQRSRSVLTRILKRKIEDAGASSFKSDGRTSWGTQAWLTGRFNGSVRRRQQGPSIDEVVRRETPDILIIVLGGNDAGKSTTATRQNVTEIWNRVKTLVDVAIWVAPPSGYRDGNIIPARGVVADIILSVVGSRNFIDSRTTTSSNKGRDALGVHLRNNDAGREVATRWATQIINSLERRFSR